MNINELPIVINRSRYLRVKAAAAATGYSEKAIEMKRQTGVWVEGREWHKAPDGCVVIDMEGFEKWIRSGKQIR